MTKLFYYELKRSKMRDKDHSKIIRYTQRLLMLNSNFTAKFLAFHSVLDKLKIQGDKATQWSNHKLHNTQD